MLFIDPRSAVPPFEQLRVQLLELIRSNELAAETRLPTVRKLASDLGIAPNTVARTYRELEGDGIIETRGRHGTFVSSDVDPVRRQLQKSAAEYAAQARSLGASPAEALTIIEAALNNEQTGGFIRS